MEKSGDDDMDIYGGLEDISSTDLEVVELEKCSNDVVKVPDNFMEKSGSIEHDMNLLDDLIVAENNEKKEKEQKEKLEFQNTCFENSQLKETNKHLQDTVDKLSIENTNLKNNISSLYKTSKIQLEYKDKIIADLKRELDEYIFRRNQSGDNRRQMHPNERTKQTERPRPPSRSQSSYQETPSKRRRSSTPPVRSKVQPVAPFDITGSGKQSDSLTSVSTPRDSSSSESFNASITKPDDEGQSPSSGYASESFVTPKSNANSKHSAVSQYPNKRLSSPKVNDSSNLSVSCLSPVLNANVVPSQIHLALSQFETQQSIALETLKKAFSLYEENQDSSTSSLKTAVVDFYSPIQPKKIHVFEELPKVDVIGSPVEVHPKENDEANKTLSSTEKRPTNVQSVLHEKKLNCEPTVNDKRFTGMKTLYQQRLAMRIIREETEVEKKKNEESCSVSSEVVPVVKSPLSMSHNPQRKANSDDYLKARKSRLQKMMPSPRKTSESFPVSIRRDAISLFRYQNQPVPYVVKKKLGLLQSKKSSESKDEQLHGIEKNSQKVKSPVVHTEEQKKISAIATNVEGKKMPVTSDVLKSKNESNKVPVNTVNGTHVPSTGQNTEKGIQNDKELPESLKSDVIADFSEDSKKNHSNSRSEEIVSNLTDKDSQKASTTNEHQEKIHRLRSLKDNSKKRYSQSSEESYQLRDKFNHSHKHSRSSSSKKHSYS